VLADRLGTGSKRVEAAPPDDDAFFSAWRAAELARVERAGLTYLDYTGAALYPSSLVRTDALRLEDACLGNPHSLHGPSQTASQDILAARAAILAFLHADPGEYTAILTPNASAGCRLVGESFPFSAGSVLALSADNHNSVNGIREYARTRRARTVTLPLDRELRLDNPQTMLGDHPGRPSLLAFPAQSNFSGVRHPLDLVTFAQSRGWSVLLDAASYLPTMDLRLDHVRPDFVVLSLYKIAGYPTGVGALVARREALPRLRRPAFAGGTVQWVSVQRPRHRLIAGPEGFEDGTGHFLAVGAVPAALAAVQQVDRARLSRHVGRLTSTLLSGLEAIRHDDGTRLVTVHGPESLDARGATVAISLRTMDGRPIPYWDVEEAAQRQGIAVRGGCFCNPGCAEHALGFPIHRTARCLTRLGARFTMPAFADCMDGHAVGAIRISLGLGSIMSDVGRGLAFLAGFARRSPGSTTGFSTRS